MQVNYSKKSTDAVGLNVVKKKILKFLHIYLFCNKMCLLS